MSRLGLVVARCASGLICAAALGATITSGAQTSDEDARKHFEAGESYLRTSDNEGALREFQQSYALSKRAIILFSIAAVYERMGKLLEAVQSLEKYLVEDPNNPNRATIELRIANLKKRLVDANKASTQDAGAPSDMHDAATAVGPVPAVQGVEVASPAPTAAPSSAPAEGASVDHSLAYGSWAIGGAAALGAIVTGLVAQGKYNSADDGCAKQVGGCPDSEIQPIKTMALVSTILTGLAVVGAGVGTVLYFSGKPPVEHSASATGVMPRVSAGMAGTGGRMAATWVF